ALPSLVRGGVVYHEKGLFVAYPKGCVGAYQTIWASFSALLFPLSFRLPKQRGFCPTFFYFSIFILVLVSLNLVDLHFLFLCYESF
ncbi:unnamed protein product, partial [Arabidopsis halleri]